MNFKAGDRIIINENRFEVIKQTELGYELKGKSISGFFSLIILTNTYRLIDKDSKVLYEGNNPIEKVPYYGKAGAGVLLWAQDTGRFLLALRSQEVREGGTFGVIGGKMEENETPEQTALTEFEEETGIRLDQPLELIYKYISPELDAGGNPIFNYHNFLCRIPHELTELEEKDYGWETDLCKWFSLSDIKRLNNLHFGIKCLIDAGLLDVICEREITVGQSLQLKWQEMQQPKPMLAEHLSKIYERYVQLCRSFGSKPYEYLDWLNMRRSDNNNLHGLMTTYNDILYPQKQKA